VDNFERRRNQYIYGANGNNVPTPTSNINPYYQGNRNPFIDHPEYVWTVFGSFANDSQLSVGSSPNPNGSSATTVTLRVMKNAAWTATSTNLNRSGAAPTTYNLTASGSARTTA